MTAAARKAKSGSDTCQRLLEAAEQLFAEEGFDKVSVRDITERAEANVAAVNYHFRSREGLVEAVMERYINPINEERLERLKQLERRAGGKAVPLEESLEAFVRPFATQVRRSEMSEKMFYRLMGRVFGDQAACMPASVERGFTEMAERFLKAFGRALPELDDEELVWRMHFVVGAMLHTMAHAETLHRMSKGVSGHPKMETTLARFLRFAAAGMRHGIDEPAKPAADDEGPQGEFLF